MKDLFTDAPQPFDEEGDAMAFGYGLGHGFMRISPKPDAQEASKRNKFYYYPGFALGYTWKIVLLIAAAHFGLGIDVLGGL